LLGPVSKLADNISLSFSSIDSKQKAKTIISNSDRSVVLLGEIDCLVQEPFLCVIPDCKTFLRLFSGIEANDLTLTINSNIIEYKQNNFSFKYHLLDELYSSNNKTLSEEKIQALTYDTSFVMSKQKLSEIIKYNSIIPDAEKLYFFTQGSDVLAKIGDEQKSNINEIVVEVNKGYSGQPFDTTFPINIQNVLLFSFNSDTIIVSVNHSLKIFKFETPNLRYIVSGLVK
jgi:hypothetical protein